MGKLICIFMSVILSLHLTVGCQNRSEIIYIEDNTTSMTNEHIIQSPSPTIPIATTVITPNAHKYLEEQTKIIREDVDFRNSKWGDSMEDVLKYEYDIELSEEDGGLIGECVVAEENAQAYFIFENNKLVNGGYYFDLNTTNGILYISAYNRIKDMLIDVYGEPTIDEVISRYGEVVTESVNEVLALEAGYTVYAAQWETETTVISLGMFSEDNKIICLLSYMDINYEKSKDYSGL